MPSVDLDLPLVAAGASASNDWASASADTNVTVAVGASLKRGFCAGASISALATADAGLQQFVKLEARGNAFADAQASIQLQLTLNAFEKLGLTIGAQAKAQAAAGLQVGLGLVTGDFIKLIEHNADVAGLPLELVLLLLEETSIDANVKVHVAAAAAAYAEIKATLQLVPPSGQKPGFFFTAKAGVGVALGVGFGASFGCGLKDPGRFFNRAVDLVVDTVGESIDRELASSPRAIRDVALTFRPVAKLALRHAFELGHFLAENKAASIASTTDALAETSVRVIREEFQQFFFESFLQHALGTLKDFIADPRSGLTDAVWRRIKPQRLALAGALRAMPDEPFVFTPDNVTYWSGVIVKVADFAAGLPPAQVGDALRAASVLYASSQLLIKMNESRSVRATAYASAIGAGRVSTPPAGLSGRIGKQPPRDVKAHINAAIGRAATTAVRYQDLVAFLSDSLVIDPLRQRFPHLDALLGIFKAPLAATETAVLATLLSPQGGGMPAKALLEIFVEALDTFIESEIIGALGAEVEQNLHDDTARLYFNEVVLGTLRGTKDLTLRSVLTWDKTPPNRDDFLEVLSSIALMPVSRAVVILFDGLLAAVQKEMPGAFAHAATTLNRRNGPFQALNIRPDPILKEMLTTVLESGGDIFGPLPDDVRTRVRHSLYEVFELLPPGSADSFLEQLGDDFFVPNLDSVNELKDELLAISVQRFTRFAEAMMMAAAAAVAALLQALYDETVALIQKWEKDLDKALKDLETRIAALVAGVEAQVRQAEKAMQDAMAAFENLLETLESESSQRNLKTAIVNELNSRALTELRKNPLYTGLPSGIRTLIRTQLKSAIKAVVGPLADPVLAAVGAIAGGLDDLLDDIQQLNPNRPLDEQILNLLLDAIEDDVRRRFGGDDPSLRLGFDVAYEFYGRREVRFELGRIRIPIRQFCRLLRDVLGDLTFVRRQAEAMARALAGAFDQQLRLAGLRADLERAQDDRRRADRIKREHVVSDKTVAILNPQPQSVHDHRISARVHLGGVPESYLGLDRDELQRVFVLLNGQQLSIKSLVTGADVHDLSSSRQPGNLRLADLSSAALTRSAGVKKSAASPKALLRSRAGALVIRKQASDAGGKAAQLTNASFTAILPGRKGRASDLARWDADAQAQSPGITIALDLAEADLARGANTLTVLVVDPGGRQYQHTVSFAFLPNEVVKPIKGKPARPVLPGGVLAAKPTRKKTRTPSHWMFDAAHLQQKRVVNRTFSRSEAALNFGKKVGR